MCSVSAITDYYREKWPVPQYPPYDPNIVYGPTIVPKEYWVQPKIIVITQAEWDEYQELKRRMTAYDLATGQPDCVKPEVEQWENIVKQFVKEKQDEL